MAPVEPSPEGEGEEAAGTAEGEGVDGEPGTAGEAGKWLDVLEGGERRPDLVGFCTCQSTSSVIVLPTTANTWLTQTPSAPSLPRQPRARKGQPKAPEPPTVATRTAQVATEALVTTTMSWMGQARLWMAMRTRTMPATAKARRKAMVRWRANLPWRRPANGLPMRLPLWLRQTCRPLPRVSFQPPRFALPSFDRAHFVFVGVGCCVVDRTMR